MAIKTALAEKQLAKGFKLTKDHIVYFLERFRQLDATDRTAQKKLVEVFVNAIFLYDDHLKIAFNYTEGDGCRTVTLSDIEKADTCDNGSHVSTEACIGGQFAECSSLILLPGICWIHSVFILSYELPPGPLRKKTTT